MAREKDLPRFQLFYSSPSGLSLFWYVCQLWNAEVAMPARNAPGSSRQLLCS